MEEEEDKHIMKSREGVGEEEVTASKAEGGRAKKQGAGGGAGRRAEGLKAMLGRRGSNGMRVWHL